MLFWDSLVLFVMQLYLGLGSPYVSQPTLFPPFRLLCLNSMTYKVVSKAGKSKSLSTRAKAGVQKRERMNLNRYPRARVKSISAMQSFPSIYRISSLYGHIIAQDKSTAMIYLLVFVGLAALVFIVLRRRYFTGISDISGLFFASFSLLWQLYHIVKGDIDRSLAELHEKYGMCMVKRPCIRYTSTNSRRSILTHQSQRSQRLPS